MNYSEQERFFSDYHLKWSLAAAGLVIIASFALRNLTLVSATFFILICGAVAALSYLPKYLQLHYEPDKRYAWAVQSRWIMTVSGVAIASAWNIHRPAFVLIALAAGIWLALVNGFVKRAFHHERLLSYRWMPLIYFFGDFWLVVALAYLGLDWLLVTSFLAISLVFAVVIHEGLPAWFPVLGIVLSAGLLRAALLPRSYGLNPAFLIILVALATTAAAWLTVIANSQAKLNYKATIAELRAFTGFDERQTAERLLASREMLVSAWTSAKLDENDKNALAQWYKDNSLSYLFDIARFHLTYKHILFTLDVLKLSRGRCLDYGAGKGALGLELARRGMQVTYFDVPGKSREYAECNAKRQDLQLQFTSNKEEIADSFDTIISLDVLEHMPDLAGELQFLTSRLAPGGRMIMTVPVGATESHPMHLSHNVQAREFLGQRRMRDIKDLRMRLTGSEILRKPDCLVVEKNSG